MRYTTVIFEAKDHRPEPFLGRQVRLPELEGFSDKLRRSLENPLLSFDQAQEFMEAVAWFANGYDKKLDHKHWGVFTARTLEAMFWRLADMVEPVPRWGQSVHAGASRIQVHCEGMGMHHLSRDMTITAYYPPGSNIAKDDYETLEYPISTREREYLDNRDEGNARVSLFWSPLEVGMVVQALAAWEALRFTDLKDANGKPRRFNVNAALLREQGPAVAMGALLGEGLVSAMQAAQLDQALVEAPGQPRPHGRL